MIIHDVEQGTEAWHAVRRGIPTASQFSRIVQPSNGLLSKSAKAYAMYLAAEVLLKSSLHEEGDTKWTRWGKDMEPEAVRQYCVVHDRAVRRVGFITTDDGSAGCSPDRLLVGENAALEVKCPSPAVQLGYLYEGTLPLDYRCQVQGQIYIAELDYVDFYAFHPSMPELHLRIGRDREFIENLQAGLQHINALKLDIIARCSGSGFFEEHPEAIPDFLHAAAENAHAGFD